MPTTVANPIPGMWELRGTTVNQFGRDKTGLISYQFNLQGFRSAVNYDFVPGHAFFGASLVMGIGVPVEHTFAAQFSGSQNYGVCGTYSNQRIFDIIQLYLESDCHAQDTKKLVVWTDRGTDDLDNYYRVLRPHGFVHFFCGERLPYDHCYLVPGNLDLDVSQTHMGVKTHQFFYRTLCHLFNQ